jgi:ribose 5-phosphate isomerase B
MKIYISSDHGGFYLKQELVSYLQSQGHAITDFGAKSFETKDDYTDYVIPMSEALAKDGRALGIVLGRSGNGEAIAANKVNGVYAAHCLSEKMAVKAREHNNANVLALGAEYTTITAAKRIVQAFIKTPFSSAARHRRRVNKIKRYESAHTKKPKS